MISKQEGGRERRREGGKEGRAAELLLPREPGDWAARSRVPPPPSPALYGSSVPAESSFSRGPRLGRVPGDRRGSVGVGGAGMRP